MAIQPETLTLADFEKLLFLAESVVHHTEAYTVPSSQEKRRELRMGSTIFIVRARDRELAGAIYALCEFIELLKTRNLPPNLEDTAQIKPVKGE